VEQADIGLIGLAVMGQNLVLNMNDKGFVVSVYNRTSSKTDEFLSEAAKGSRVQGFHDLKLFAASLKRPRKVMLMVQAGQAVDLVIDSLLPFLEKGDIVIDGGNSHYPDTERRFQELADKGIHFIGAGISGGEEGARFGPSIMPGGDFTAWPAVKPIFQAIAAKVGNEPCCEWVGSGGAGHYVKMVHNGIEYGDMQLICECYDIMKILLKMDNEELADTFASWNKGVLDSYLIEITEKIFRKKEKNVYIVDTVLDAAGQKGTGKWTAFDALEKGIPLTLIGEAVFARFISSLVEERKEAAKQLKLTTPPYQGNKKDLLDFLAPALYAAKILSYTQGFMLMQKASEDYKWNLNFGAIALLWRGGCIIRSRFLGDIRKAYAKNPALDNLLFDDFFKKEIENSHMSLRKVVAVAAEHGIPTSTLSSSLSFLDSYRRERLPANLLQAQRDFFGAHTYEKLNGKRGEFFHTEWEKECTNCTEKVVH